MIRELWSDRPTFKRLRFREGLNLLVVHRSDASSVGQKRNAAGKSAFVDIVHFLMGGEKDNTSPLAAPELSEEVYNATLDVGVHTVTVSRSYADPGRVSVVGETYEWPIQPDRDPATGEATFTIANWRDLLGQMFFGLPPASRLPTGSWLSFRSCFAYFARKARTEAFDDFRRHFRSQKPVDWQVTLGTLLGLDRQGAIELHRAKDAERERKELRKLLQDGLFGEVVPTIAKLRQRHRQLRRRLERLDAELAGFRVVDAYEDWAEQANELQRTIDELANATLIDQELVGDIQAALNNEAPPALPDLERLYNEAGVALPGISLRRYKEVEDFHKAIVRNRREHLQAELDAATSRIADRQRQLRSLSEQRNSALDILNSGGALTQYRRWDAERSKLRSEFEVVERQLELSERVELLKSDVRARRAEAERKIKQEVIERRDELDRAYELFESISAELYDESATFAVSADRNGLALDIDHPDIKSIGVNRMQIFTFDLMIALLCAERGRWPGFLVHDSHLFDGVDGRQIALALKTGGERLAAVAGQYLVTINSDDLEKAELESGIEVSASAISPFLNDSDTGGLFGFRFSSPLARTPEYDPETA